MNALGELWQPHIVRRYSFGPGEGLYRDHEGRMVLADAEGPGEYRLLAGAPLAAPDGVESSAQAGSFAEHFLAYGEGGGDIELAQPCFLSAPSPRLILSDSIEIGDPEDRAEHGWKAKNSSDLFLLESEFEDGSEWTALHLSHLNRAEWTFAVTAPNCGGFLRKIYDRFHGRQRARVLIDGEFVGWWYEPREDRIQRWAVGEFPIPARALAGKESVQLCIDPPSGTPLWSVSRLELWLAEA